MLEQRKLNALEDFFIDASKRNPRGVYFYRIYQYNANIEKGIRRFFEAAGQNGMIFEGGIANPLPHQLNYYFEIMGQEFRLERSFYAYGLKKWMPRLTDAQREDMAGAMELAINALRRNSNNENILKNTYIKLMCWLYYRMEGVVYALGRDALPKILYEGTPGKYELALLYVLSCTGADVLLLEYGGDGVYQKEDPENFWSHPLEIQGSAFPQDFSLKKIRNQVQQDLAAQKIYGLPPRTKGATNVWLSGKILEDVKKAAGKRGKGGDFYYNLYARLQGVEDEATYENDLYKLTLFFQENKRKTCIVNHQIPQPANEEIQRIVRNPYNTLDQMLGGLKANINFASSELRRIVTKVFLDICLEEDHSNLRRMENKAVILLCWLNRYKKELLDAWQPGGSFSVFIFFGNVQNENEAMFLKFLGRLPVDVLIFDPDLQHASVLKDDLLYEQHGECSMAVAEYPDKEGMVRLGTMAYHAERQMDGLLYQDTGLYRNMQYKQAVPLVLSTTFEEIKIYWSEALSFRPNFSVEANVVNMPVIFAKVSGVGPEGVAGYWSYIKSLLSPERDNYLLVKNGPLFDAYQNNPMKPFVTEFYRNGKWRPEQIKAHWEYQYGYLREEAQDFILDKIRLLIESRIIKGTFENGTEYTIISVLLALPKEVLRLLQKFDFTKKNPKLVWINTTDAVLSLEDAILTAFLNLVGFDIVFFVPTGYSIIERHYTKKMIEEHQIGEYQYDLNIPDFNQIKENKKRKSFWGSFFGKG